MIRSPAFSSNSSERKAIISGTFQISWLRSPCWRISPFTFSHTAPALGWPISLAGPRAEQGAECSNALPTSQGGQIGRAHVGTPVTNAHLVRPLLLDKTEIP